MEISVYGDRKGLAVGTCRVAVHLEVDKKVGEKYSSKRGTGRTFEGPLLGSYFY